VTDYSANNKTVSDEIRYENKSTYQNNVVVVSFSLFVRETTQCILPNPPCSFHALGSLIKTITNQTTTKIAAIAITFKNII